MNDQHHYPHLEPWKVGTRGRCPRCGEGHLFNGFLTLRPNCERCGLDYSFADPADGPAFFSMLFASIPAVVFALWLEVKYEPSYWVHILLSVPLLLITCVWPLRPLKGWLVASQYYHKAEEGQRVLKEPAEQPASSPGP